MMFILTLIIDINKMKREKATDSVVKLILFISFIISLGIFFIKLSEPLCQ